MTPRQVRCWNCRRYFTALMEIGHCPYCLAAFRVKNNPGGKHRKKANKKTK